MVKNLIRAVDIKRYYSSSNKKSVFKAVDGISFELNQGEIISFVGPNGAGKTTLIKSISNYLIPTSGSIEVNGIDLLKNPKESRRQMGVVFGGDRGFYNNASAADNLDFFARVLGVKGSEVRENITEALEIVNLADVADKKVGTFSKGMLQRLHIARGLVNKPEILMLDEPTAGLDVESVYAIRKLIKRLSEQGRGIILTSHAMADIENLAQRIYLIGGGKIHYQGDLEGVKKLAGVSETATLEEAYLAIAPSLKRGQL